MDEFENAAAAFVGMLIKADERAEEAERSAAAERAEEIQLGNLTPAGFALYGKWCAVRQNEPNDTEAWNTLASLLNQDHLPF